MSEEIKTVDKQEKEFQAGRSLAMGLAWAVYTGVVLTFSVLFISYVLIAFPPNAYLSKLLLTVGGALVGLSMIAFPVALHNWIVDRKHRIVAIAFYYGEIAFMAVNSITAFAALLAVYANNPAPAWVVWYEPFSIGAIAYTVVAWATIFIMDPEHKAKQRDRQLRQRIRDRVASQKSEYFLSRQGEDFIRSVAEQEIREEYDMNRTSSAGRDWGTASASPAPAPGPVPDFTAKPSLPPPASAAIDPDELARQLRELKKRLDAVQADNHLFSENGEKGGATDP